MIDWYSSGPYLDRLYGEDDDVLEKFDFDPQPAGAWLLGTHIAELLDHNGIAELLLVLDDQDLMARLAKDMGRPRSQAVLGAMVQGVHDAAGEATRSPLG